VTELPFVVGKNITVITMDDIDNRENSSRNVCLARIMLK